MWKARTRGGVLTPESDQGRYRGGLFVTHGSIPTATGSFQKPGLSPPTGESPIR